MMDAALDDRPFDIQDALEDLIVCRESSDRLSSNVLREIGQLFVGRTLRLLEHHDYSGSDIESVETSLTNAEAGLALPPINTFILSGPTLKSRSITDIYG